VALMLFMPSLSGVERDMDMEIEFDFCEYGPSDGARLKVIIYLDLVALQLFMLKKAIRHESLRWFLLLQEFEFEVREKG